MLLITDLLTASDGNSQVQTPIAHSNLGTMYQMFNLNIVVVLVKFQQAR